RRGGCPGAPALHLVERQRIAVSTQRVKLRELEEHRLLPAQCSLLPAWLECERQSEVVEEVDEHRLARPDTPLALELAIDPGQRDRIVQRVMRPAGVGAEPQRAVFQLGAVAGERANER